MDYAIPKCTCGAEIEFDFNDDFWGDDTIETTSHGHCPNCNKKYQWTDYYVLSHWDNLEEIE